MTLSDVDSFHLVQAGFPATYFCASVTGDSLVLVPTGKASFLLALLVPIGLLLMMIRAKKRFRACAALSIEERLSSTPDALKLSRADIKECEVKRYSVRITLTSGEQKKFGIYEKQSLGGNSPASLLADFMADGGQ